jgi:hypothetical protein
MRQKFETPSFYAIARPRFESGASGIQTRNVTTRLTCPVFCVPDKVKHG